MNHTPRKARPGSKPGHAGKGTPRRIPAFGTPTSARTYERAIEDLTAAGWDCRRVRMETSVQADEVNISPAIGEVAVPPGFGGGYECQEDKHAYWLIEDRMRRDLCRQGWSVHGMTPFGTLFRVPSQAQSQRRTEEAESLADAPPGDVKRLRAIAEEVGISDTGTLRDAVYEAAVLESAVPDTRQAGQRAAAVNSEGIDGQLAFLFRGCGSERALRLLLEDLHT